LERKIRTGGIDELATQIAAFVLPKGTNLEAEGLLLGGNAELPDKLFDLQTAYLIQDRYRTIKFSGYTWNVKSNENNVGPGPNRFSAGKDNVWVDASGNLHMTIIYENNRWYCTEVFTQAPLGYGTYTFTTASPIDQLDKNAVLGLFTWDDTAPENNYREIDIEISKWGDAVNENSQYVVQPWEPPANIFRFDTILDGIFSTHRFKWESDRVFFSSHQGHEPSLGDEIASWLYTDADVPPEGDGNARINLWLYNGLPPSDGQNIEVVLEAFNYDAIPVITSITRADPNPTDAASVDFIVTFSEIVTGVDETDFELIASPGITGASISAINGSGSTYTVTINTGTGTGTIRLDVLDDDTIMDGTDNPLGGTGMGNGNFTTGETYNLVNFITAPFETQSTYDGWILESSETSNKGGEMNSTATLLYIGDNAQDKQYRSFLSFDTSSLPEDASITKVQLKIKVQGFAGGNMFKPTKTHGNLLMDIRNPYFGANADLEITDFQIGGDLNSSGVLKSAPSAGWYTVTLKTTSFPFVNLTGTTQFRLRFQKDDNDDLGADYLKIYSGDAGAADHPQLIIEYYTQ
jgi:hypothetical protein